MHRPSFHFALLLCFAAALCAGEGCSSPSRANIDLRKKNQSLEDDIARLKDQHEADRARIMALESRATTVPVLPQDRLDRMFTAHALAISRLTGGADLDRDREGDEGLKVFVNPVDESGSDLKATGQFTIEAFDLSRPADQRIGRWTFDTMQSRDAWVGLIVEAFVFTCPWHTPPSVAELTLKVTFVDELTGRELTAQKVIHVKPPAPAKK